LWSTSLALVYSRTPIVTTTVPKPLRNVTGLPNKITDIHIRKALFTVLATLKIDNYHIRSMYTTIITICDNVCYNDNITTCNHVSPAPIERGVRRVHYLCDIFISVKVSHLLCFQDSKVWISTLEEDRKKMGFDLKGWLFILAYMSDQK
jgi:hypothetical protein